jgi:hypothetical protein
MGTNFGAVIDLLLRRITFICNALVIFAVAKQINFVKAEQ